MFYAWIGAETGSAGDRKRGGAMSVATRAEGEGLITMTEAARRLRVSRPTLRRSIRRFGFKTYEDPVDARVRLLRSEDVTRLLTPILEAERRERVNRV
jgi:DNA-binding MurR/RpiR family transcriptional regulator